MKLVPDKIVFDFDFFDRSHSVEFKRESEHAYRLIVVFCAVHGSPSNAWSGVVAASDVVVLWATVQDLAANRRSSGQVVIADGTLIKVKASASPPFQFLIPEHGERGGRFEAIMRRCLAVVQDAEFHRRIDELF